ncbi:SurA N-terminal domain-containing protein [Henriciella sp. AS95]|uniref:SurA N-terminal domain-containing protein n=1 Tax=Henriciella sp. AS95 TaxID=3135782 RepID=UPI00317C86B1
MLTLIRNMLRTKLAGLLFLLLIIAMGAWGVTDVFSGGIGNNMAVAGNTRLTEAQLDQEIERELRTATDDRGRAISKAQAVEQGIVDQIYQRELFRTTMMAYADKLGATATDNAVLKIIREDPSFASDTGNFDPARFNQLLQANGFSIPMFEAFLKRDMTISRLTGASQTALQAPQPIAALQAAYNGELRKASWFILPRSALPPAEDVTDEDLQTYYDQQKQAFAQPQRRAVSLIQLKLEDFLNQADLTEEDLRAYYEAVKTQQYAGPDTRTWTEFTFATEAEARQALGRIAGGATASTISGLANSAERSGPQTSMASAALAERVFGPSAQPGGIFGPVQTGNFFTVARLESIQPGEVEAFETVRDDITDSLSREQAIGLYYDSLSRLDNLIGTGAGIEEIAAEMGTPVLSFVAVDRSGVTELGLAPSILRADPEILTRAFDLTEGAKTARFGQDETAYMLRVDAIEEARTPEFDEIRDDLRTVVQAQRNSELLGNSARQIKSDIEAGTMTFADAAAEYDSTISSPDTAFTRRTNNASAIPPQFVAGVFSLAEEGDIYIAPMQNRDEVAIVQLVAIDRASAEEMNAMATASGQQIVQQLVNDVFEAFATEIQKDVELEVNQRSLESYKSRVNPDS